MLTRFKTLPSSSCSASCRWSRCWYWVCITCGLPPWRGRPVHPETNLPAPAVCIATANVTYGAINVGK